MSDHLVRVGNLKAIQRQNSWNDSDLARHCRRTPQQVRSWFQPVGANGFRAIGEKLARDLEIALGLAQYALDDRASENVTSLPPRKGGTPLESASDKTRAREVPTLMWAQLESMLEVENSSLRVRAPQLETFAVASTRAKFVQMNDDSMEPEFTTSDHILFDPTEAPRAGDVVLIRIPSGEYFVRVFRPRTAHVFEAVPTNEHYQPLSSEVDGAEVRAVMVEHRRYRRQLR